MKFQQKIETQGYIHHRSPLIPWLSEGHHRNWALWNFDTYRTLRLQFSSQTSTTNENIYMYEWKDHRNMHVITRTKALNESSKL